MTRKEEVVEEDNGTHPRLEHGSLPEQTVEPLDFDRSALLAYVPPLD